MADAADSPGGKPASTRTKVAVAGILIAAVAVCGGVLGVSIRNYIDKAIEQAVTESKAIDTRIDVRARAAVLSTLKSSPAAVAESLNSFIAKQQADVLAKEESGYRKMWPEMSDTAGIPVSGDPQSAVRIVYFFDSACPWCRKMDPVLSQLLLNDPDVSVLYREIPILGPASERAAKFTSAVWKTAPEKFAAFHWNIMGIKGALTETGIDRVAQQILGEEAARVVAIAVARDEGKSVSGPVSRNLEMARELDIKGTPFIAVGGQAFFKGAVDADALKAAVDKARASAK